MVLCSSLSAFAQKRREHQLNKAVKEVVHYQTKKGEVRHGTYTQYYSGMRTVTGNYKNGQKHGRWRRIDSRDLTWVELHYKEGKKHGDFVHLNEDADTVSKGRFQNGLPHGEWISYFKSGTVRTQKTYDENGIPVTTIHRYPSGEIARNIEVELIDGDTLAAVSDYYPNTQIARYYRKKNGKRHGKHILYYENGVKREELRYKEGKLLDAVIARTESGKPLDQGDLIGGAGKLKRYNSTGGLYSVQYYRNGLRHDTLKKYKHGKLREKGCFINGKPHGKWEVFNDNFKKKREFEFEEDTTRYKILHNRPGSEYTYGTLVKGYKNGSEYKQNRFGNVEWMQRYKNGLMHGPHRKFHRNSKNPRVVGRYQHGIRNGEWIYYNDSKDIVYYEMRNNDPVLYQDPFEPPPGYMPYANNNIEFLLSEQVFDDSFTELYDAGYFLPEHPGYNLFFRGFNFYSQEYGFNKSYRNTGISYRAEFQKPAFAGDEKLYLDEFMVTRHPAEDAPEGAIIYRIKVDELGMIEDIELIRSVHPDLDAAAYSLLQNMPALAPGTINGFPTPMYVLKVAAYEYNE